MVDDTTMPEDRAGVAAPVDAIVMRWISAADALPKHDTHMVLVTRYGATDIAFWRNGKFLDEPMGFAADGVTHWMYMPQHAGA